MKNIDLEGFTPNGHQISRMHVVSGHAFDLDSHSALILPDYHVSHPASVLNLEAMSSKVQLFPGMGHLWRALVTSIYKYIAPMGHGSWSLRMQGA